MLALNVNNEYARLRAVLFGTAQSNGKIPSAENCYDPSSLAHVLAGTYPTETAMQQEMSSVMAVFQKYDVTVFRPNIIENCKRDISCENLIVDLKTLAIDTPAAYLLLGKSFDENSNTQLFRDKLSCDFDKNKPLAAMYYSYANKENVPEANDLLKTLCNGLTGLDKDLASKECGFQ